MQSAPRREKGKRGDSILKSLVTVFVHTDVEWIDVDVDDGHVVERKLLPRGYARRIGRYQQVGYQALDGASRLVVTACAHQLPLLQVLSRLAAAGPLKDELLVLSRADAGDAVSDEFRDDVTFDRFVVGLATNTVHASDPSFAYVGLADLRRRYRRSIYKL